MASKNKGIDYSKWDRMDFSDDDDSTADNDDYDNGRHPRVTSLDHPGRVTLNADGTVEIGQSPIVGGSSIPSSSSSSPGKTSSLAATAAENKSKSTSAATNNNTTNNEKASKAKITSAKTTQMEKTRSNKISTKMQQLESKLTHNGGMHYCTVHPTQIINTTNNNTNNNNHGNGNITDMADVKNNYNTTQSIKFPIYWTQDRYTVTLRLAFPPDVFASRSIRVRVTGALDYVDRFSAVGGGSSLGSGSTHGHLEIVSLLDNSKQEKEIIILKGDISRPIHLFQDEEEIGFDIEDNPLGIDLANVSEEEGVVTSICSKFVVVTLPKAVPMEGMVLWWDCPLIGFPKVDVTSIGERNVVFKSSGGGNDGLGNAGGASGKSGVGGGETESSKKEAFQKAWEEAHAMFREKMKKKEVQYINVEE